MADGREEGEGEGGLQDHDLKDGGGCIRRI